MANMSVFGTPRDCARSFFPEKDASPPPRVTRVTRGENALIIHVVGKPRTTIDDDSVVNYHHPFDSSIHHEVERFTLIAKEFPNAVDITYVYLDPDTRKHVQYPITIKIVGEFLKAAKNWHEIVSVKHEDLKPDNDPNKVGLFPNRSCQTTSKSFDMGETTEHADEKM